MKVRIAVIGLGKMGISHLAIIRAHPDVEFVAICDGTSYIVEALSKYSGLKTYTDYEKMFAEVDLHGVFIAVPSEHHVKIVEKALARNLHVFCEKPFSLDVAQGRRLVQIAQSKGLVNQVGYHYRFVSAFNEAKRLIDGGALGKLHHVRAEAYGPVVLRKKNTTWRAMRSKGGGCLYDYACHAIDLVNFFAGKPDRVAGTILRSIHSSDVDDEVYTSLFFNNGLTGQLASNWSDESHRKMQTKLTLWGSNGRITVDRQEIQMFIRDASSSAIPVKEGWTSVYTTDLKKQVSFYLRGEEYTEQVDHFIQAIRNGDTNTRSTFASALETDEVVAMMMGDASPSASGRSLIERPRAPGYKPGILTRVRSLLPNTSIDRS